MTEITAEQQAKIDYITASRAEHLRLTEVAYRAGLASADDVSRVVSGLNEITTLQARVITESVPSGPYSYIQPPSIQVIADVKSQNEALRASEEQTKMFAAMEAVAKAAKDMSNAASVHQAQLEAIQAQETGVDVAEKHAVYQEVVKIFDYPVGGVVTDKAAILTYEKIKNGDVKLNIAPAFIELPVTVVDKDKLDKVTSNKSVLYIAGLIIIGFLLLIGKK